MKKKDDHEEAGDEMVEFLDRVDRILKVYDSMVELCEIEEKSKEFTVDEEDLMFFIEDLDHLCKDFFPVAEELKEKYGYKG